MYMFDMNRRYDRPLVPPIQIKHIHSSVSYQWAIYQKYNLCGCESPSGYGALVSLHVEHKALYLLGDSCIYLI